MGDSEDVARIREQLVRDSGEPSRDHPSLESVERLAKRSPSAGLVASWKRALTEAKRAMSTRALPFARKMPAASSGYSLA